MPLKIYVVFILLSLFHCYHATQLDHILTHPKEVVYRDEGSNVSFEWDFQIGSWPNPRPKVVEFVFGEWVFPGHVRTKILYVKGHNQVKKQRGFEKKVDWKGNVYECVNCTAVVVMYNLTRADFKSYGVDIELGVDRSPLTNWLKLVKTEPASITKWTQNIEVHEGNSTTIECRASGLPSPTVKIQRNNQTLKTCNDTKPCVYKIQAVTFEDQGEYVCLVQQGNSSVIISRSLNLTVLENRESSTMITVGPKTNELSTGAIIGIICAAVILVLFIVIVYIYFRQPRLLSAIVPCWNFRPEESDIPNWALPETHSVINPELTDCHYSSPGGRPSRSISTSSSCEYNSQRDDINI